MNFIEIYKNAYSVDFCNKVIEFYNVVEKNGFTVNRQVQNNSLKIQQDDNVLFLPGYPLVHCDLSICKEFNDIFWEDCYPKYISTYDILKTNKSHLIYGIKVQKTEPGQGYHVWHYEATNKDLAHRFLTWTVYLNDTFEAGETEFLYQQYRYKPSRGDLVIFPAAFTHTHRGNPPIGGTKYIITGWVEF